MVVPFFQCQLSIFLPIPWVESDSLQNQALIYKRLTAIRALIQQTWKMWWVW
jgi:hypothetical protein